MFQRQVFILVQLFAVLWMSVSLPTNSSLTTVQTNGDHGFRVRRSVDLAKNRGDLESIKAEILSGLGENQCGDQEQKKLLVYYNYKPKLNVNFVVKNLYDERFLDSSHEQNKRIVYKSIAYVRNDNSEQQEMSTTSFARTETKTTEVSITNTFGFSLEIETEFKVPFGEVSVKVGAEFSREHEVKDIESVAITVAAPSQKVIVKPHSQVKVVYYVLKYTDIQDYSLDFELSDHSLVFGKVGRCYSNGGKINGPLIHFAKDHLEQGKQYGQGALKLEYTTDEKLVLRNIPAKEKIVNYGIKVEFGPQQPIKQ